MKKLIYLILLGTALLSASCSKKPACCVLPQPVVMTAQKNGVAWQSVIVQSTRSNNNISIVAMDLENSTNSPKDSLSINLAYTGLGNYSPTAQQVAYTTFANGVKTKYVLDTNFYNRISITEFAVQHTPATTNPDPTELKATFTLRFIDPANNTSVMLSDGKFTAYLSN